MYDLRWTMDDLESERAGGAGIAKQQQRWWAKQCLRTVRKAGAVADGVCLCTIYDGRCTIWKVSARGAGFGR